MSRPPGRGSALTAEERREIQRLSIVEKLSISTIARRVDRDRGTVSEVLRSPESVALRQQLETDEREQVQKLLKASGPQIAREWIFAATQAAARGDHKPSKDLLLHSGLVDPVATDAGGARIAIVIGTDQHPMRVPSPLRMLQVEEDEGHGSK
jgi:hypothetical protein